MKKLNFKIRGGLGGYSTLDREYNSYINKATVSLDEDGLYKWDAYNLIMTDLLKLGLKNIFEEVKYRVTDGENPNHVLLEVINRDEYQSEIEWFLRNTLESYINEDYYN